MSVQTLSQNKLEVSREVSIIRKRISRRRAKAEQVSPEQLKTWIAERVPGWSAADQQHIYDRVVGAGGINYSA